MHIQKVQTNILLEKCWYKNEDYMKAILGVAGTEK